MQNVVEGKPFIFRCGGLELSKVLLYFGYIPDASSSDYKIVCPFHQDVNPSMAVNLDSGIFYCFGCGATGDALTFVTMMYPKLNSLQCVRKLFEILKSDKIEKIDFSNRVKKNKKGSKQLYDIAWDYYYGLSAIDWKNNKDRDVNDCLNYMERRGFNALTLNKCNAKITYNNQYPIIFPMFDNDEFKGWVCRTTNPEIEKKRKYLYNTGFMRRTTLVGNYNDCETVFIVEGYMDRLKFIQFGVTNVVAILGWKMTKEQELKLKKSGITHVISALDNDECGMKGTKYLSTIFSKVTRFRYFPGIKDPGEMNKNNFKKMYIDTMKLYHKNEKER